MQVVDLKDIPTGYLPYEHHHRSELVQRGWWFWEPGSSIHIAEYRNGEECLRSQAREIYRFVVDQHLHPVSLWYIHRPSWRKLDVLKIHGTWLNPRAIYGELFVPDRKRETLISIFSPYQDVRYKPPDATLVLLHGGPGLGKATSARVVAEVLEYPPLSVASADIAKQESESVARLTTILDSGTGEY
ncbi:hypothetical protein ETB97_006123 [Aspergillus alliaceus]|uniref:ATPase AAA-type core domain-containing protein n=1 Tax=Petromyces alliaceus TaxID=209559 RepID=A0A8H6ACZ7_PETAA|nr:hypothetical protein ETB97_006123 [Aspergillus burnettii]